MSARTQAASVATRNRWILGATLVLALAAAWTWLIFQARQIAQPAASAMGDMAPMVGMGPAPGTPAYLAGASAMWAVMMAAMMLPSAAPMILVRAGGARRGEGGGLVHGLLFAALYLATWTAFALAAALAQSLLAQTGVISPARLAVGDARLAGVLLVAAGLYQLTPVKRACLTRCRSPAAFLAREWRPGLGGAVRLGLLHGLHCLGCCWLLMFLLFVGGVMNLAWVALLAALVLAERVLPLGHRAATAIGALALSAGASLLLAPDLLAKLHLP
jgi:predicted metal-binding membrane protein